MKWRQLLLATANQDKVKELSLLLKEAPITILSINDLDTYPKVVEDKPTLEENAIKKAIAFARATGYPALADDTGLEVDILDGAPGVYSARYAGAGATYDENVDKLLRQLDGIPYNKRRAKFRTVMALAYDEKIDTVEGVCQGYILHERRGADGFGYDPVFFVPEFNKTFAEMALDEKNKISHRGRALQKAKALLQQKLGA